MAITTTDLDFTDDTFRVALPAMLPLIKHEWPALDVKQIRQCGGDLDACISLIAQETPETKRQVRKHLEELHRIAVSNYRSDDISKIKGTLYRIEAKTNDIVHRVRTEMLPTVQMTMRQNVLVTVFASVGLGFLLGFIVRGTMRKAWRIPVKGLRSALPWTR